MFAITPIGSCRITTPLKQGRDEYGFQMNMKRCYGYCHSPAEAVQMARFMLGQLDFPADIWPLVSPKNNLETISAVPQVVSDLYVVEFASAKQVSIDGVLIQLNYLSAAYPEFFADKARAKAFWGVATKGTQSEKEEWLGEAWSDTEAQIIESKLLSRISLKMVTLESLIADLNTLKALLPNILLVSHVDATRLDGTKIASRSAFIKLVAEAAAATNTQFCNPTELMAIYGQPAAIKDESTSLAHFTDQFSDALMAHWMETVIDPLIAASEPEVLLKSA